MTGPVTWAVATAGDAARVRAALDRALRAARVPTGQRLPLVSSLSTHLRESVPGSRCCVALRLVGTGSEPGTRQLRVSVHHGDAPSDSLPPEGAPEWQALLPCPAAEEALREAAADPPGQLATALLEGDRDLAELHSQVEQQTGLIDFYREELHQTNQGVLALHAELDTAVAKQRGLLSAERHARAEAEAARSRLQFLAEAGAALGASLNHNEIIELLHTLVVPRYARSLDVRLTAAHGRALPLPGPRQEGTGTLRVPLNTGRATLGALVLTPLAEAFSADDVTMLKELAHRAATALDNALSYEHHREVAETLQQAMLPRLPDTPGLVFAARYLPATSGLNVGGDWYDVFAQPDGSLITVVGDVTGHGLDAAVAMGQLRTALRAYAVAGDSPGALLGRLHTFLLHFRLHLYATAVAARFRPGDPSVTWAAAGHPPPLLRDPSGAVQALEEKSGPMLGLPLQPPFVEHTVPSPPGSTLLLYSDGLVERRSAGIVPGIDRLRRALAGLPAGLLAEAPDRAADELLTPLLADSRGEDDVCLLLCHTTGAEVW